MHFSLRVAEVFTFVLCLANIPCAVSRREAFRSTASVSAAGSSSTTDSSHVRTTFSTIKGYSNTTTSSTTSSSTTTSTSPTSLSSEFQILPPSLSHEIVHPTNIPHHPWGTGFISSGRNALPQIRTNGRSPLGTFQAPRFPPWIGHGRGIPQPWGNRDAGHSNPYQDTPHTGVTRYYNLVINRQTIAPDGVERSVILVNDQFPGPTIEADWGDMIQVTVTNGLTDEGTSIHWHGLLQTDTPFMDGIPGITQCPIAPGQTFTYLFKADLYGSSWYHAHYSAQYAGGLFGAMIIHGPSNADYDVDLGPILVTDYYHEDYYTLVEQVMGTDLSQVAPHSVNNLINGKGVYNCSLVSDPSTCTPDAGLAHFSFESGTTYRLRVINGGAEGLQKFSIDEHVLTVIAYDFVPIEPYETTVVTLGIGQRADVLVTANLSSTSSVWMRSTISSCSLASQPNALAMIYYESADTAEKPSSNPWTDSTDPCANDDLSLTTPYFPITPPSTPATTEIIQVNFGVNATGHLLWTMNNSSFRVDYNSPILSLVNQGNTSYPYDPEWNVYNFGSNSSVRLVVENLTPVGHPMHLHGHNMYVLNSGTGSWDGTVVNPQNPMRRDVQLLVPNGFIVVQIDADNPGVWPFHW